MHEQYMYEITEKYTELYTMLLTYAVYKLKNESLAEEAVQETFRIACQKADAFYDSKNRNGWLVKTLKNVISNTQRKQFRAHTYSMDLVVPQEDFSQITDNIDLDVLYSIHPPQRVNMLLKYDGTGKSNNKTASHLNGTKRFLF